MVMIVVMMEIKKKISHRLYARQRDRRAHLITTDNGEVSYRIVVRIGQKALWRNSTPRFAKKIEILNIN